MQEFEYKVIPAPREPKKAKGVKGVPGRFAHALTLAMNDLAAQGWEYMKSETLPMDMPKGLLGNKVEMFQTVMIFRREVEVMQPDIEESMSAAVAAIPAMTAADVVPSQDDFTNQSLPEIDLGAETTAAPNAEASSDAETGTDSDEKTGDNTEANRSEKTD